MGPCQYCLTYFLRVRFLKMEPFIQLSYHCIPVRLQAISVNTMFLNLRDTGTYVVGSQVNSTASTLPELKFAETRFLGNIGAPVESGQWNEVEDNEEAEHDRETHMSPISHDENSTVPDVVSINAKHLLLFCACLKLTLFMDSHSWTVGTAMTTTPRWHLLSTQCIRLHQRDKLNRSPMSDQHCIMLD